MGGDSLALGAGSVYLGVSISRPATFVWRLLCVCDARLYRETDLSSCEKLGGPMKAGDLGSRGAGGRWGRGVSWAIGLAGALATLFIASLFIARSEDRAWQRIQTS